jgi:hypothetical protein
MRLVVSVSFLLLSVPALAFDFKGVTLGGPATPAQIEQQFGAKVDRYGSSIPRVLQFQCGPGGQSLNWQVCNGPATVADIPAQMNLVIDEHGIVQRINLTFISGGFAQVKAAILEKFGPAAIHKHSTDQNRMGATFDDEYFIWKDDKANNVLLKQYAGDLDHSILSFTTKADRDKTADTSRGHSDDL